ncbi:MAG TPA: phosphatase PAP2 family protein [Candidatus Limnocylindrales bacterium]|jgi:undecaprenyl-diphosphatase
MPTVEVTSARRSSPDSALAVAARTVPPSVAARRSRLGEAIVGLGLGGFAVLFAAVRTRRTEGFDHSTTVRLQRWRHPTLTRLLDAVSWPGFPPQSRCIPPAVIVTLWLSGLRQEARTATLGWGSALVSTATKALMNRPRPVAGVDLRVVAARLGGSSFPSGHVLTYVGTYGTLAYLGYATIRPPLVRTAVVGGLVGLVALVGPSRLFLGHHWATDVTASYLLGGAYLVVVTDRYRRAMEREAGLR